MERAAAETATGFKRKRIILHWENQTGYEKNLESTPRHLQAAVRNDVRSFSSPMFDAII
jgi:hypothetical protein